MLELSFIIDNRAKVLEGLRKRNFHEPESTIDRIIAIDKDRRDTQLQLDNTNSEIKKVSNIIDQHIKASDTLSANEAKETSRTLKDRAQKLKEQLAAYESNLKQSLVKIPNIPHPMVPEGSTPEENFVVCEKNPTDSSREYPLAHWDLVKKYNLIDFEVGNKIAAAGFPVYKGKCARLQRALINFFLDSATAEGYLEVQPPVVVNEESAFGTGQLPDMEGQMYQLVEEKLYLIPTSEVPLTNMLREEISDESELPIKYVSYTPCFRREAGSWGSHVRGLNRLHQFDKVELVQVTHPQESYRAIESMLEYLQKILDLLGIHYRVLKLCCGDMGFKSALQYDIEAWSAGQKKWLEISSLSNFETYQTNRMGIRYRDANGKIRLLHTLNGSCFGIPRLLSALLENNQTKAGITIPEVLQPYMGFQIID